MTHSNYASNYTAGKDDNDVELDKRNSLLYNALLMQEETSSKLLVKVKQYPEGPLHVLTIHGDTVLHMAAHKGNADLVIQLLEMLGENEYRKLTHQNAVGNTILHEAATFNKLVPAAKKMLEMAPTGLLSMHNHSGETALFSAARYGQIEMFTFLHIKVQSHQNIETEAERKTFYQKDNNTTVLHTAVFSGQFDCALTITKVCGHLVAGRDEHGMTALQYLACNSAVFKTRNAGSLKHFIYYCLLKGEKSIYTPAILRGKDERVWRVPLWEAIRKEVLKYESAKKLASFLVGKDNTSWKETYPLEAPPSETQNNGGKSISSSASNIDVNVEIDGKKSNTETPLFLAIKAGCVDIVEMILKQYAQAVELVDSNGCTILHIAIKYRQLWVFDVLHQVGVPWRRLILQRDRNLNTILHMVGQDSISEVVTGNSSLQLKNDLLLFEDVKKIWSSSSSVDPSLYRNGKGKTAKEVFVKNKEELRMQSVEWVRFLAESSSWLGVFIATAAFSAVFTLPGGLDDKTGVPILLNQPFFLIFIIADSLCLLFCAITLTMLVKVITSSYRFKDFKRSIPARLNLAIASLLLAVTMLGLAFVTAIFLILQKRENSIIGFYTFVLFCFTIFSASFLSDYFFLARDSMSNLYITRPPRPPYTYFSFRSCIRKFITPPPGSNPTPLEETTHSVV